jgi:hypothetical protein
LGKTVLHPSASTLRQGFDDDLYGKKGSFLVLVTCALYRQRTSSFRPEYFCRTTTLERSHSLQIIQRQQCLRFVAAVSASFSGDKSDKEESAGCFSAMGIVRYSCNV